MKLLIRYARLYASMLRFSFSKTTQFRADFAFRIVMDLLFYAVQILFFKTVLAHSTQIGSWGIHDIYVFLGTFFVIDALYMSACTNNHFFLTEYIIKGDIDYYLLRPVNSLFLLSFRDFAVSSFVNLLVAIGLLVWAIAVHPAEFSVIQLLVFSALLFCGFILYVLVRLIYYIPCFWTQSGDGLVRLSWSMGRFMERPDPIYSGWVRRILTLIVPYAVMTSFPARILIEGLRLSTVAWVIGLTVVFAGVVSALWNLGLRSYGSASS